MEKDLLIFEFHDLFLVSVFEEYSNYRIEPLSNKNSNNLFSVVHISFWKIMVKIILHSEKYFVCDDF
ncbi:unnamed protein product [Pneumocystis jirovecii]|uniref:Uncharacterized protein n=1 Tax=Pneumocystis jirovecii TaxID=42068 RepID=L0PEP4_PNEJI|nr:unnamed protein product [Pneumocystis jirovecii]